MADTKRVEDLFEILEDSQSQQADFKKALEACLRGKDYPEIVDIINTKKDENGKSLLLMAALNEKYRELEFLLDVLRAPMPAQTTIVPNFSEYKDAQNSLAMDYRVAKLGEKSRTLTVKECEKKPELTSFMKVLDNHYCDTFNIMRKDDKAFWKKVLGACFIVSAILAVVVPPVGVALLGMLAVGSVAWAYSTAQHTPSYNPYIKNTDPREVYNSDHDKTATTQPSTNPVSVAKQEGTVEPVHGSPVGFFAEKANTNSSAASNLGSAEVGFSQRQ